MNDYMDILERERWRAHKDIRNWHVVLEGTKGPIRLAGYNVAARSAERAIKVAKNHCIVLRGRIYGTATLATPEELGATRRAA